MWDKLVSKKLMPTPNQTLDYNELLGTLMAEWQPTNVAERQLVVDIAESRWGMWRMTALEMRLWNREMNRRESSEEQSLAFAKELQAVTRTGVLYSKRYHVAVARLLRLRKDSQTPIEPEPARAAAGKAKRSGLRLVSNERLAA
jgi:hypothetical protein